MMVCTYLVYKVYTIFGRLFAPLAGSQEERDRCEVRPDSQWCQLSKRGFCLSVFLSYEAFPSLFEGRGAL